MKKAIKYVLPVVIAVIIFIIIKVFFMSGSVNIKDINLDKFMTLKQGSEQVIIYVTTDMDSCGSCKEADTLLKKLLEGSKFKIYKINASKLTSDELTILISSTSKEGLSFPSLFIVGDDEIKSSFVGPYDEEILIKYFQDNKVIE